MGIRGHQDNDRYRACCEIQTLTPRQSSAKQDEAIAISGRLASEKLQQQTPGAQEKHRMQALIRWTTETDQ
jgi:hypothetical protein